jgi:hypothetical protein
MLPVLYDDFTDTDTSVRCTVLTVGHSGWWKSFLQKTLDQGLGHEDFFMGLIAEVKT